MTPYDFFRGIAFDALSASVPRRDHPALVKLEDRVIDY
jgi:hypothetical protein